MNLFQEDSDSERTEVVFSNMKRSFDNMVDQNTPVSLRDVKQNLRQQFCDSETPAKMMKFHGHNSISTPASMKPTPGFEGMEKMRRMLNLKEADVITLKATITKWEKQVAKLEAEAKEREIYHDREIAKIKAAYDREVMKSSEVQSKFQYLMEKEKVAKDELEEFKKDHKQQKMEMDKKILDIQREKLEADVAHQLLTKRTETESSLREELITSLKSENNLLRTKYEETDAQLKLRKRLHQDSGDQDVQIKQLIADLQEEKDKFKALSKTVSDHEDNMVITKAMKKDLDLVPSMKSELEKLRMDNEQLRHNEQNTLLLEEELHSLKSRLDDALARCDKYTELEIVNEDLQARLQRWEASDSSGSRRPQSPSSLSRRINELETSQAMMLYKQGDVESSLQREKNKLEQVLSEKVQLSLDLSAKTATVQQQNDLIKRLKRKLLLTSQVRDSYKSVLDSYESEATINIDVENQRRAQSLEEIVKGYQHQSEENETQLVALEEKLSSAQMAYDKVYQQLQVLQTSGSASSHLNKQDQDSIQQLKEQVAVLENSLLTVQEERDVLEARIEQRQLQGDYDPSKTKIVHMVTNPISEGEEARKELVKRLTSENDSLRKRNEILESTGGQVEDLTIQVNEKLQQPSPTKELEAMKQDLKRQETRNKRLMEVFTKTSKEFREICYQLTGYRIDIPCSNQYRLTNLYSTSPNDYLWFQQNEAGEIQMLKTDFSNTLTELMERFLQKEHSIPLFLSQVTMDLYSKQTLMP